MEVKQIKTRLELNQVLREAGDKLVVVMFFATWCGPCRKVMPYFKQLAQQYTNMAFFLVDTEENYETAEFYNVNLLPTFILYKNALKVERTQGCDAEGLKKFIEKNLAH